MSGRTEFIFKPIRLQSPLPLVGSNGMERKESKSQHPKQTLEDLIPAQAVIIPGVEHGKNLR